MRKLTSQRRLKKKKVEEKPEEKVEEPNFKVYDNFTRVLPKQEEHIVFLDDNRYKPVLPVNVFRKLVLTVE